MTTYKIKVSLNGTNENPYHAMGLTQNPFPQVGKAEFDARESRVAKLGADPIPHDRYEEYIREMLEGCSNELIELCICNFRPGVITRFTVHWTE